MAYFLQVDPEKLSEQIKKNTSSIELNPFSHRMAFISNELLGRGFFSENNIHQLIAGQVQLPLLTWPFLDFILTINNEKTKLIELGSGNSTLWFAKLFKSVVSYETNQDWCNQITKKAPANCRIIYTSEPELILSNIDFNLNDWLLIDFAGHRTQFIFNMLSKKNKILPSVIILDNSDWYRKGAGLLYAEGYVEIPFFGFKSGQMHLSCTSIFFKDAAALNQKSQNFKIPKQCMLSENNAWDDFKK